MSVDPTARSLQALALSRLIDKIVEDAKKEEGLLSTTMPSNSVPLTAVPSINVPPPPYSSPPESKGLDEKISPVGPEYIAPPPSLKLKDARSQNAVRTPDWRRHLQFLPSVLATELVSRIARKRQLRRALTPNFFRFLAPSLRMSSAVSFHNFHSLTSSLLETAIVPALGSPESLDFSGCQDLRRIESLSKVVGSLEFFNLKGCRSLEAKTLLPVLQKCSPTLTTLNLSAGPRLTGFPLDCLKDSPKLLHLNLAGSAATRGLLELSRGKAGASIEEVDISGCSFNDAEVAALGSCPNLRSLCISFMTKVEEGKRLKAEIRRPNSFPSLNHLDASRNPNLSDDFADAVRHGCASTLRSLNLSQTGLSDDGLRALGGSNCLKTLDVAYNPSITDAGVIEGVPRLPCIDALIISYTSVGDQTLEFLARRSNSKTGSSTSAPPSLRVLKIAGSGVSDVGVRAIVSSRLRESLEGLDLGGPGITDAGARALASTGLPRARRLNLWHTEMRKEAALALVMKHPHLRPDPKMKTSPGTLVLVPAPRRSLMKENREKNEKKAVRVRLNPSSSSRSHRSENPSLGRELPPEEFLHLARRAKTPSDVQRFRSALIYLCSEETKRGINTDRDKYGRDALMLAARSGNKVTFNILQEAKADMTTTDNNGNTALMHAAMGGFEGIALQIVKTPNAPILDRNDFGKCAADFAEKFGLAKLSKAIDNIR
ncbi:hypothetical protein AAMO2058_000975800 [Amorphochlora amoebiformis]